MRILLAVLGMATLLFSSAASSQGGNHAVHGGGRSAAADARKPTAAAGLADDRRTVAEPALALPAFRGYRPYRSDEPLVGWREANDLVLQVGGHVGIMKGAAAKDETPGAHAGHHKSRPAGAAK